MNKNTQYFMLTFLLIATFSTYPLTETESKQRIHDADAKCLPAYNLQKGSCKTKDPRCLKRADRGYERCMRLTLLKDAKSLDEAEEVIEDYLEKELGPDERYAAAKEYSVLQYEKEKEEKAAAAEKALAETQAATP